MTITSIFPGDFEKEVLQSPKPYLVIFFSPWSLACKELLQGLPAVAEQFAGRVTFGKINADASNVLITKYQIRSTPTLLLFNNGKILSVKTGDIRAEMVSPWLALSISHI